MKTTNKILILIAFGAVLLGTVGCYSPITAIKRNRFFFETVYTKQLAVNNVLAYDTLKKEMQLEPRLFKCRKVNDRIESKDNLVLAGFTYLVGRRQAYELGDTSYYRWIPVDNTKGSIEYAKKDKRFQKYYIPDNPIYWEFGDISITSPNASFGEDYPIGSDLTPIVTFQFSSLMEFIQNKYKGPYTVEHSIRANDRNAWQNLMLFEAGHSKLTIDRMPTNIQGDELPALVINLKFKDKVAASINADPFPLDDPPADHMKEDYNLYIKLLLDIE